MVRDVSITDKEHNPQFLYLLISGALFGAVASTLSSAIILYLKQPDSIFSSLLFWSGYFCFPAGMIAGMLGSIWLGISVQRTKRRFALIAQGILAGIFLGLPITIFTVSVRSHLGRFFPSLIGAIVGGSYALIFHSLLIKCRRS